MICRLVCAFLFATSVASDDARNDLVITMERTACFGTCPAYKLTIQGDGSVLYEGRKYVRVVGPQQGAIDKREVAKLAQAFVDAGYFELRDHYHLSITDLPTTYTSITLAGHHREIEDYAGAPEELLELERKIDEVAGSKRWAYIDSPTVHKQVKQGWDLKSVEAQKLLLHAAEEGDTEVVQAFIEEGFDVNTPLRLTPLQVAGGVKVVKILIAAGADVNAADREYFVPPLAFAIQRGDLDSMKALIDAGAKVNRQSPEGGTALMVAARTGNPAAVKLLLQTGADAKARTTSGDNALKYAAVGLKRQTMLATQPEPFERLLPNYQQRYRDIEDMLIAAGAQPTR